MDEALVRARVAGRQAANELADLYITESARLKEQHGLEAAIAFFETLRDNLIAIRPLPVEKTSSASKPLPPARTGGFQASDIPDGYVEVELGEDVAAETDKAILIGQLWIPKSVIAECPEKGDLVETLAIKSWFAEKEGLM